MRLAEQRIDVRASGRLTVAREPWAIANEGAVPVAVDAVAIVYRVADIRGALRMFRNGFQSWSPAGTAVFGVDADPSAGGGTRFL